MRVLLASKTVRRLFRVAAIQCALAMLGFGVLELGLRLATDGPYGVFLGWFAGPLGLYPENAEIEMPGVVPWVIKTNRWGLRGADLSLEKTPDVTRIAMVGDSITDSVHVDNPDTFPVFTEMVLRRLGAKTEVMNCGRSGASIDTELAILRDVVTGFQPDVVVLTFVTNDVPVLARLSDDDIEHGRLDKRTWTHGLVRLVVTQSALGERVFDVYLRLRSPVYQSLISRPRQPLSSKSERYDIPGGANFAQNSSRFMDLHRYNDGQMLSDPFSPEIEIQLGRYLKAWDMFMEHARHHDMRPVFVYFPFYSQVYDEGVSLKIRDVLRDHSAARGVPFLDLTPVLRSQGGRVLHLAPADFHLNPEGNRVIGEALGNFVFETVLRGASRPPSRPSP